MAVTYSKQQNIGSSLPGAKVSITRNDGKTCYRLGIPWKQLSKLSPMPGRIFGFNFVINQNNGKGRHYWLGLTEGIGEGKYPYLYRKFKLGGK